MSEAIATVTQSCLIDLHLHLDGSMSVAMARRIAEAGGMELDLSDDELRERLTVHEDCRDLNEYLARFDFPLSLLQTRDQLRLCTQLLQEELSQRGLMYAELRFAPQSHGVKGLTQREAVEAVLEGLGSSCFEAGIILCCMRGADNLEANLETVRLASEYLGQGVVAVDLAGAEALFPTRDFQEIFELAERLGVPSTIHAGEADGPQSMWDALSFGADRIGHGIRAVEDPALVEELAKRRIPLEACPTSEVQTCIFERYDELPLHQLLEAGVPVTINSDNMAVSATDVRHELQIVADTFALTDGDIKLLLLNAANAAFASDALKAEMCRRIKAEF